MKQKTNEQVRMTNDKQVQQVNSETSQWITRHRAGRLLSTIINKISKTQQRCTDGQTINNNNDYDDCKCSNMHMLDDPMIDTNPS